MTTQTGDRLAPEDAAFLYFEREEAPLHMGSVSVLDGEIGLEEYIDFIASRLPLIPRYRQRLVVPPFNAGHPTWEYDPDFDIRNHIREVHLKRGTMAELERLAGSIFSKVMDRGRPLWDLTLVQGLSEGRSAFISRVHHCLVDGVSGVGILNIMLSPTRETPVAPEAQPFQPPELPDASRSLLDALTSAVSDSIQRLLSAQMTALNVAAALLDQRALDGWSQLIRFAPELLAPVERFPFNIPVKGPQRVAWTQFPIAEVCAIRRGLGGTLNDVVLAALARAMARYVELHGQSTKNRVLRLMVPVNLRRGETEPGYGNRVSALPVNIPLDIESPAELIEAIRQRTDAMKSARVADLIELGTAWMGVTPAPLQAITQAMAAGLPIAPFNMVCTNVPGPQYPLYLLGREMVTFHPYVPIGNELGIGCAIQSYNGQLYFGLTADRAAAGDVDRLNEFLEQALAELSRAATEARVETAPEPKTTNAVEVPTLPER